MKKSLLNISALSAIHMSIQILSNPNDQFVQNEGIPNHTRGSLFEHPKPGAWGKFLGGIDIGANFSNTKKIPKMHIFASLAFFFALEIPQHREQYHMVFWPYGIFQCGWLSTGVKRNNGYFSLFTWHSPI